MIWANQKKLSFSNQVEIRDGEESNADKRQVGSVKQSLYPSFLFHSRLEKTEGILLKNATDGGRNHQLFSMLRIMFSFTLPR